MSEMEGSGSEMTTISRHLLGDDPDQPDFSVSIIENIKEEYGLFVWPCSVVLAEYVWQQRLRFAGAAVVELGAGTSLPGLVAAKVGADESSRLEVLSNMRSAIELNKLQFYTQNLFLELKCCMMLKAFDDLFATVAYLLQNSPGSVFITTYHNRSGHHLIEFLMVKWGLKCTRLLDAFSFMPSCKSSGLSGNLQLAEIVLDSERS
ncbi:hypothetical protein ACLB2K_008492 [Fragaria x ananassa]